MKVTLKNGTVVETDKWEEIELVAKTLLATTSEHKTRIVFTGKKCVVCGDALVGRNFKLCGKEECSIKRKAHSMRKWWFKHGKFKAKAKTMQEKVAEQVEDMPGFITRELPR